MSPLCWLLVSFGPSGKYQRAVEEASEHWLEPWASDLGGGEFRVCVRLTGDRSLDDPRRWHALYHAHVLPATLDPDPGAWLNQREQHYYYVAEVAAPLHRMFALTNHREKNWTTHPEVRFSMPEGHRSTSVGDVIVSRETGMAWMVLPVGVLPLPTQNEERLEHAEQ